MKTPLFTGSGVAIVTPFTKETVDLSALGRLLDFQLASGTDAVIVCGTTGEASTMSYRERMRAVEFCVDHVDGRVPVIAGSGSNSTENALALSRDAERAGSWGGEDGNSAGVQPDTGGAHNSGARSSGNGTHPHTRRLAPNWAHNIHRSAHRDCKWRLRPGCSRIPDVRHHSRRWGIHHDHTKPSSTRPTHTRLHRN